MNELADRDRAALGVLAERGRAVSPDEMWSRAREQADAEIRTGSRRRRVEALVAALVVVAVVAVAVVGRDRGEKTVRTTGPSTVTAPSAPALPKVAGPDQLLVSIADRDDTFSTIALMSIGGSPVIPIDPGHGAMPLSSVNRPTRDTIAYEPALSHDRRSIAFVTSARPEAGRPVSVGTLMIMNVDGSDLRRVGGPGFVGTNPVWSPDDQRIAFLRDDVVYTSRLDGSASEPVANAPAFVHQLAWSTTGALAFGAGNDQTKLYTLALNGDRSVPLTTNDDSWPAYSSDGRDIAFSRDRAGLFIRNLSTGGETQLTHCDVRCGSDFLATWSPDGRRLVFVRSSPSGTGVGDKRTLYVVNADGTGLAPLPDSSTYDEPSWS